MSGNASKKPKLWRERLIDLLQEGKWKKSPSKTELAKVLGISRTAVYNNKGEIEKIFAQHGIGTGPVRNSRALIGELDACKEKLRSKTSEVNTLRAELRIIYDVIEIAPYNTRQLSELAAEIEKKLNEGRG